MKKILPQSIVLISILAAVVSSGCQRSIVNNQLPVSAFLAQSDDSSDSIEMLFGIGRMSERNGKTDKAIEAYQSILSEKPDHANAMHRMGVIKAKQGLISEAMAWMEKASQQETPSAELIGDMGYVLYLDGDLSAAKRKLEDGLQRKPNDARMTNNLAIVTGAMKQYNESMDLFRQNGTEAEALAAIAYIQTQGGHVDAAKKNYMKSLELDGTLEIAANGLIQLDQNGTNSSNTIHQPLEIEMPSPAQLATYHNGETSEQPSVVIHEAKAPKVSSVEPMVEVRQLGKPRITPIIQAGNTVMLASAQSPITPAESESAVSNDLLFAPAVIEPLKAELLPTESAVVQPNPIPSSKNINTVVKGRLRGPAKATVGDEAGFQLSVENTSSDVVRNVEVTLALDTSIAIASVSHAAWLNEETNSVTWTLVTLAAGAVETIDFDAISNVAGTQTHRLTIKVDGQPVGELSLDTKVE